MNLRRLSLLAPLALLAAGCARLDAMGDRVEARSTCHTSDGQYVNVTTGCTISYSAARTVSTTTTTTTTVETPQAEDES